MFERFGDDARRVVVLAQEDARLLLHNYIGTEHLLLAMLNAGAGGIAADVLLGAGITYDKARAQVVEIIGTGGTPPSGHIPFTPRAKTVLELSLREALELDDAVIGSEHILLGLIREGTGVGAQAMVKLGADLPALRHQVIGVRSARASGPELRRTFGAPSPARGFRQSFARAAMPDRPEPRCSFCGRSEDRVPRLLVAGGMSLCTECARAAVAQLDELPDDAPKRVRFRRRYAEPADQPEAIAAIERAFDAVVGPMRLPVGEAFWAVEGGAELAEELRIMDRAVELAPLLINDVSIERVRFVEADEAEVGLGLWIAGNPTPMVQPAHAVRVDGTWKVSRDTIQRLAAQARMIAPD